MELTDRGHHSLALLELASELEGASGLTPARPGRSDGQHHHPRAGFSWQDNGAAGPRIAGARGYPEAGQLRG